MQLTKIIIEFGISAIVKNIFDSFQKKIQNYFDL